MNNHNAGYILSKSSYLWISLTKISMLCYTNFVVARLPCPRMREYYPQDLAHKARFLLYISNITLYVLRVYNQITIGF